ncbi:MAG: hypothetical protein ACYSW0_18205 [Planctomycetota bacterium]|jgi:hypothetical protein
MQEKILDSLRQQNARLRKAVKDKLGDGVWGLVKNKEAFTHEEILFLFARVYPVFGIDHIKEIRTNFPDCKCVKDGKEVTVEFEPVLSNFQDHINKDDLTRCQYIVCWKDDLDIYSPIREEINKNGIQVIQLKQFYQEGKVKKRTQSIKYSEKDFRKMSENKLRLLYAFISKDENILTSEEISEFTGIKGKPLGGVIGGFSSHKDWIVRQHPKGWEFNTEYVGWGLPHHS